MERRATARVVLIRSVINQFRMSSNRSSKYRYIGTTDRMSSNQATHDPCLSARILILVIDFIWDVAQAFTSLPTKRASTESGLDAMYVGTEWADTIVGSLETALSQLAVHTVPDAAAARSEHTPTAFDCLISEHVLPNETGAAFLSSYAGDSDLPSLLLASEDAQPTASEVVSANVTDYFVVDRMDEHHATLAESIENAVTQRNASHHERLEFALELADAGAWEYEIPTETVWWNKQAREIHGVSPDRTLSLDGIDELYTPDDRRRIRDAFDRAINEREPFDEIAELDSDDRQWEIGRAHV